MNKINKNESNEVFSVTLKILRENQSCFEGYNRLVRSLQGMEFSEQDRLRGSYIRFRHDDLIPIEYILNKNGVDDALMALRCVKDADRDLRLFAVWCARQVQPLMNDKRSTNALDVAERFANGQASSDELIVAMAAASAAAMAAVRDAAWAAASAASAAAMAAVRDAAWAAASAARDAASAARGAAWAAAMAARDAASAARGAAWAAQKEMLIKMCRGDAPWQVI